MNIIGLAGRARTGKSTVANYLRDHYGYEIISLADPIRWGLAAMFGLSDKHFEDHKEEHIDWLNTTPRKLMQTLGTEWGRNLIGSRTWIKTAERRMEASDADGIVIPDIRFGNKYMLDGNEAEWLRDIGGTIVHVVRPDAPAINGVAGHVSESGVTLCRGDQILWNTGAKHELFRKIDGLMYALA